MRIDLQKVSKQLGAVTVLDELEVQFSDSQIYAVLGANGAGKTTLLHLLGGLYQPTSGRILLDEEPMDRRRMDQRLRLHYLPDIPTLNPGQTPVDYIVYAVEAYGQSGPESDRKIVELLDEFDLLPVADCPSRSLSRGQRYKTTLVAMLAVDPELWIMDEPFTSGMDPLGLNALRAHMYAARDRGRIIVYSTQLVELAQQTSDQVCVLSGSKVAAFGTANSLQRSAEHSPQLNALLEQLRGDEEESSA